jgi:hypothetical protein
MGGSVADRHAKQGGSSVLWPYFTPLGLAQH